MKKLKRSRSVLILASVMFLLSGCDSSTSVNQPLETKKYGDVNEDGKVDNEDRIYLARYVANWDNYPLTDSAKNNADVNDDNIVDEKDRDILARYIDGWEGYEELPNNINNDDITLYGDVNEDGIVNAKDIAIMAVPDNIKSLGKQAILNGDINLDGKYTEEDNDIFRNELAEGCGYNFYHSSTGKEKSCDIDAD